MLCTGGNRRRAKGLYFVEHNQSVVRELGKCVHNTDRSDNTGTNVPFSLNLLAKRGKQYRVPDIRDLNVRKVPERLVSSNPRMLFDAKFARRVHKLAFDIHN